MSHLHAAGRRERGGAQRLWSQVGSRRGTLKNLQTVAGTLAHMPGRKNIVLFSEGFKVSTQDNAVDIFRHLTSSSNQAAVTFHSIDAAGPRLGRVKGLGRDPTAYLELVALDTGGQHVRATNDITGALRRVTAGMRDYYRLTYSPTNTALDGRYRAITVKVRDPEAVVTSRNGYLASPRAGTPMVAPHDVAPHVLLDAETLPADFAFTCDATRTSSHIAIGATVPAGALTLATRPSGFDGGLTVLARMRGKDGQVVAASSGRSAERSARPDPVRGPSVAVQQDTAHRRRGDAGGDCLRRAGRESERAAIQSEGPGTRR